MNTWMTTERRRKINELISLVARNKNPEAWQELYLLLRPFAVGFTVKRVQNHEQVEDIVQSSFLRFRQICHRYRVGANGFSFFSGTLRMVIMEQLRGAGESGSARAPLSLSYIKAGSMPFDRFAGDLSEPEGRLLRTQMDEAFERAVKQLPPAMAEAAELRIARGLNIREAAEMSGCTVPAMRKRLARAVARMRSELAHFRVSG